MSLRRRVMGQESGGGEIIERGTVSFHTGEALKTLTIPISAEVEQLDNYVIAVRPIKTWASVDGEWIERDSMDFAGIEGFKSGSWNPVLAYLVGTKCKMFSGNTQRLYTGKGVYSNGTNGNTVRGEVFSFDSVNNCLVFSNLNGACVCVADGGLTFEYIIWRWDA